MSEYKDSACEVKVPADNVDSYGIRPRDLLDATRQVQDGKTSAAFEAWWSGFFSKVPIIGDDGDTKIGAWAGWCAACDTMRDLLD